MNSERNPNQHTKTILATLAIASVVGALCYYVLETDDAAVAGAGIVSVLGFWWAARLASDRDRASGPRFSLAILLELFVAFALAFKGIQIVGSFDQFGDCPSAPAYLTFYGVKLLLTFFSRSHLGMSNRSRTRLSIVAYIILVVVASWFTSSFWEDIYDEPLLGVFLLYWFGAWFTVPTATFISDIRSIEGPTIRYAVWRSVLEILFLSPITYLAATILMVIVMFMLGFSLD